MNMQQLPPSQYIFPDPIEVDPEGHGLICIGADLSPSTLLEAYTHGLFPWFNKDEPICWWSPEPRCVIKPYTYKPSKSLIRNMKKHDYHITVNHAFEDVIRSCSLPRSYANETWISEDIIQGYCALFHAGYAYSVEVWQQDKLVGGLYGVNIGKGCFDIAPLLADGTLVELRQSPTDEPAPLYLAWNLSHKGRALKALTEQLQQVLLQ